MATLNATTFYDHWRTILPADTSDECVMQVNEFMSRVWYEVYWHSQARLKNVDPCICHLNIKRYTLICAAINVMSDARDLEEELDLIGAHDCLKLELIRRFTALIINLCACVEAEVFGDRKQVQDPEGIYNGL